MTVSELLTEYVEIYVPTVIDQKSITSRVKTLLTILSGEVEDITYEDLLDYRSIREGAGIGASSVNKELSVLDSAINWGKRYRLLNDGFRITVPLVSVAGSGKCLSPETIQQLINSATDIRLKCFIEFAWLTGARPTALKQLLCSEIESGVISFGGEAKGIFSRRKNRAKIPVSQEMLNILRRIRAHYGNFTQYVFPGEDGRGYWKNIDRAFAELARKSGVDATSHTIRHSTATALIARGVDLLTVSRHLGHKSIAITERIYVHNQPAILSAGINFLGEMIKQ